MKQVFSMMVAVALLAGTAACDQFSRARDLAEFSAYYAAMGTDLDQAERGFTEVVPRLSDAVRDPALRDGALTAADQLVDRVEEVVERHRPDDPEGHRGYQAAREMVRIRRQAVVDLRTQWASANDLPQGINAVTSFSNQWMAGRNHFMAVVGQESQRVFGAAAEEAHRGATTPQVPEG